MKRGSVALYLLFSIVISIAAGYGVYRVLRERRLREASAAPAQEAVRTERAAAPSPHPVPAPPVEPEPAADEPPPLSVAEQRAIDPDIDGDGATAGASLGMPGIDGAMPRDSVERRFRARLTWFDRCYERSATEDRGVIRVAFHIEPDGTLVEPKITGGFNDGFTACMLSVVGAISFSGPRDGKRVEVVYPIGFR